MNSRKAKAIRRLLKDTVSGMIENGKPVKEVAYVENEKNRKYAKVPGELGTEPSFRQVAPGTIMASTDSIRGVYRALKKGLKRHELSKKHA